MRMQMLCQDLSAESTLIVPDQSVSVCFIVISEVFRQICQPQAWYLSYYWNKTVSTRTVTNVDILNYDFFHTNSPKQAGGSGLYVRENPNAIQRSNDLI